MQNKNLTSELIKLELNGRFFCFFFWCVRVKSDVLRCFFMTLKRQRRQVIDVFAHNKIIRSFFER